MDLSSFIGAVEWSEFANSYRTSQFTHRQSEAAPDRFQALFSKWELDAFGRFTRLAQDEGFRLFTRGRLVPRDAYLDQAGALRADVMQKLWASGVSITMRGLEDYSNGTLALARTLEAFVHCPVQVNLYMTPGEGQGLGAHFDDHDVLVLQIHGAKTWEIYPDSDGIKSAPKNGGPGARPAGTPTVVTLEAGGWLYVPKGMWHEVRNKAAEPSIHFTISFHPLTWGRMIQQGLDKALRDEPSFKMSCPAGASVTADQIGRYLSVIQSFVDNPDVYYGGYKHLEMPVPSVELTDRVNLDAAKATTGFIWRSDEVAIDASGVELDLGYRRRPILLRPELAPVIRWMTQKGVFRPSELESLDADSALLLCKFLTNVGVLRLAA